MEKATVGFIRFLVRGCMKAEWITCQRYAFFQSLHFFLRIKRKNWIWKNSHDFITILSNLYKNNDLVKTH